MEEFSKKTRTISSTMSRLENYHSSQKQENGIHINPSVFTRMLEFSIKQKWKEVVGPVFANAATSVVVNGNMLYVTVLSPAIRNELILHRSTIVKRINEELKRKVLSGMIVK
ncbi:MAG: DUF721 domain-containing protein [Bacteroidales bacterium]|nr:DUF721 domain-containing protein [Bacteroidales bacterium]